MSQRFMSLLRLSGVNASSAAFAALAYYSVNLCTAATSV